jgi:hypothetical protein
MIEALASFPVSMPAISPEAPEWVRHAVGVGGCAGQAVLVAGAAAGVVNCFLGYVLLRALVAVEGLVVGALLGLLAVHAISPSAAPLAYGLSAAVGGVLLGAMAWGVYRMGFALVVGIPAGYVSATILGTQGTSLLIAIGIGLGVAAIAFLMVKPILVLFTAVGGAAAAAWYGGLLYHAGDADAFWNATLGHARPLTPEALIVASAAVVLAIAGIACQARLTGAKPAES